MTGVRFECQPGCTNCCEQQGFVYLTEDDLDRIAKYVGMTAREFERRYVYRTKNLRRLRVPRHQQCHFLRDGGCSIHAVKPVQCRLFPFWPELVDDKREWKKTAAWCPGIGKGELVQIETARERAQGMKTAYPSMYANKAADEVDERRYYLMTTLSTDWLSNSSFTRTAITCSPGTARRSGGDILPRVNRRGGLPDRP